MIKLLIKRFIKNSEDIKNNEVRKKYSILGGVLGIICNVFLFIIKIVSGVLIGSIAIISDAFNNFSDMGSSVVGLVGAKLSNLKPDENHPYGHGRFEYVASFIVSFIIIYVGLELLRTSIDRIINPVQLEFSWIVFIILSCSMLVKVWMYSYNKYMGNKINNEVLKATAKDSLNDVVSTSIVLLSLVLSNYVNFPIDGVMGIVVSLLILKSGIEVGLSTIDLLLGHSPSKEMVDSIENIVLEHKGIIGVHDLMIHDYGPGRIFASCHAEVLDTSNINVAHEIIDHIEKDVFEMLGITMVIHMDPISVNNEKLNIAKDVIQEVFKNHKGVSGHDFRIVDGEKNINIIFDLVIPFDMKKEEIELLVEELKSAAKNKDERYTLVPKVEHQYHN